MNMLHNTRCSKKRKLSAILSPDSEHDQGVEHQPLPKRRKMQRVSSGNKASSAASRRNSKKKQVKKMVIKKFRVQPKLSQTFEKDTVDKLMGAIRDIHAKRGGECSFEELYRSCQSLCTLNKGKLIYDKLYDLCDKHIEAMIGSLHGDEALHEDDNNNLLPRLQDIWMNHRSEMHAIRQVFLMLDRTYVRQETECKSLWKMGIVLLKKHILQTDKNSFIEVKLIFHILRLIELERNGEEIDKVLVKNIIIMIAHLNIYKSKFEKELVANTNEYYLNEGNTLIQQLTIPDYLNQVMKRLDDEHKRCIQYLDHKTQRHLSIAIEQQMIHNHVDKILEKGFNAMCDQLLINDLRHLYALFKSVNALAPLKEYFYEYSKQRGLQIVNAGIDTQTQSKQDKEMVVKLLKFKQSLDSIISQSFQRHGDFRKIIRKSWEYFINQRENKPAELMAKFVDFQLQTGARGTSEQELEETLDRVMDIFRFVNGKDVFQAFYKKDLAKRLLLNTSASEDAEKNMINRIRKECGQTVASNLENMFKDVDISQDLNEKFRLHLEKQEHVGNHIDFKIQVLTSGCWPTYNTDVIDLPPVIADHLQLFSSFYVRINSGRKLSWTSSLSHCVMAANFPKGRKELVLSAFQACVLLLFNQTNKMKFKAIHSLTKISKSELRKTMLSLVKANILLKKTKGMECSDDEEFKLNAKYENRLRRVKVNQIQIIETKQEVVKTSQKIYQDRQYQIDACVVRVMKARKQLLHQQLMAECLKQLKFDAQPRQIKKRIEVLIENEYLERDAKNNTLYHYKA